MYNASQSLYGSQASDSEYTRAMNKYAAGSFGGPHSFNPLHARALIEAQRSKSKAKARQAATAAQPQQRQEEEHDIGDGLEENCFALVSTEELEKQGLRPHPDKIAEAAALSHVSLPVGSYKMCLPVQVLQGKSHKTHCSSWPVSSSYSLISMNPCRPYKCLAVPGCQACLPEA